MNNNNYDYLFKYIVVGDASINIVTQVLENHVSYLDILNNYLKMIINLPLELSLLLKI